MPGKNAVTGMATRANVGVDESLPGQKPCIESETQCFIPHTLITNFGLNSISAGEAVNAPVQKI